MTFWNCQYNSIICLGSQKFTEIPPQAGTDFELKHGLYLYISAHHIFTQNTLKRHSRGPQAIMYFKKRGMVSGQVMLLYSSYSSFTRAVSVGDGGTMEVISLISVRLLWLVILLMFISEKSHGLCLTASVSLSRFLSAGCSLFSRPYFISSYSHCQTHAHSENQKNSTNQQRKRKLLSQFPYQEKRSLFHFNFISRNNKTHARSLRTLYLYL